MNWQTYSNPALALRLKYPQTSAQGDPVEIRETQNDRAIRAHILTPARTIYFEATRYGHLSPEEAYRQLKQEIEQAAQLSQVSPLQETRLAGQPAFTFSLQRDDLERVVLLIPRGEALYRLLYNPRDPANRQILATVEFL